MTLHRLALAAPILVAACAAQETGPPPLRQPESDLERAYLGCLGRDPYLLTSRCRDLAAQFTVDPTPGVFGR